jgi:renal tumor antigen
MDMWGVGCVFFEMVSLFPLFPGNDEVEQVRMIHSVLGTPPDDLLEKIKKRSQHFPPDFKFDYEPGTGIAELLVKAQASPECVDLINRLLAYNPDDRLCAHQVRFPSIHVSVVQSSVCVCAPSFEFWRRGI